MRTLTGIELDPATAQSRGHAIHCCFHRTACTQACGWLDWLALSGGTRGHCPRMAPGCMCVRVCARAEQSRKPVDWTASGGGQKPACAMPLMLPALAPMKCPRQISPWSWCGPPRPAQAPTAGTVRQTPRPCSLLLFQYHAQGAAWW